MSEPLVWEMKPRTLSLRDLAGAALDAAPPEVSATATSRYTRETITRRLQAIRDDESDQAQREREYLRALIERKFGG